jgi:hypothetical protein
MLFVSLTGWLVHRSVTVCLHRTRHTRRFAVTVDGEPWLVAGRPLVCGIREALERVGRRIARPLPERNLE